MGVRGRKSSASLEVATVGELLTVARPDAPYDLTDEQTEEWWAVVNRLPADWFPRETHAMLAQYCRHVIEARRIAQLIDRMQSDKDGFEIKDYDRLLKMQEREGRAITSLATKMRISQQATTRAEQAKKPSPFKKPWEA